MAVIPPDAGVRMRMQAEASLVEQLRPVRPISGDLPDLQPGQAFTARVVEALPANTYKALVAGRQLTLQLPEGAETDDTLELVVIDRTPQMLIARRAESPLAADAANQPYPYSKISVAGRMIGQLLLGEGEAPRSAALNRGQPLLAQPPASATDLAPTLAKAVSQSGLFYESHQAQWLAGQRPLASLRAEPQGQGPVPPHPQAAAAPAGTPASADASVARGGESLTYDMRAAPPGTPATADEAGTASRLSPSPTAARAESAALPAGIPDELKPLVQQQLDAVASQRLAWHGEAWPGQGIDWKIERELADERQAGQAEAEAPRWATTLRLTMPNLGAVDAQLQLSGSSLRLRLATSADRATDALRSQIAELTRALADAGLTVAGLDIHREA